MVRKIINKSAIKRNNVCKVFSSPDGAQCTIATVVFNIWNIASATKWGLRFRNSPSAPSIPAPMQVRLLVPRYGNIAQAQLQSGVLGDGLGKARAGVIQEAEEA